MPRVSEKMLKPSETGSPETTPQSSALKMSVERGGEGRGGELSCFPRKMGLTGRVEIDVPDGEHRLWATLWQLNVINHDCPI